MKQALKMLLVTSMVATFLTSDTTLSSTVQEKTQTLSANSVTSVSTIPKPRYLAFPNWETTACIRRKE